MDETKGTTEEIVEVTIVTLPTTDQLISLSKKEFAEFKVSFETAAKAKAKEELAQVKAKFTSYADKFKTYVLPVIKYGAGAYVLLRVAGLI